MSKKILNKTEIKKIQLELLQYLKQVCESNNIKYFLCYGTLLGAVRHKGFIPWDDDIDIGLLRKDYNKLIEILKLQSVKNKFKLLDDTTTGYYFPFAKLVDSTTIAKVENNITQHGIWIDIFPFDNIPSQSIRYKFFIFKLKILYAIIISMTTDFKLERKSWKFIVKKVLNYFAKMVGYKNIINYYLKYSQKYNNFNTNYVLSTFSNYGSKEIMKKEWLNNYIVLDFENDSYPVPKEYDKYLRRLYKNYMILPPTNKRKHHHIIVWRKIDE